MRRFGCKLAAIVKQMRMKYSRRKHANRPHEKIENVLKIKIRNVPVLKIYLKREANCSCLQSLQKVPSLQNVSVATYN